jgi:nitrite reductase (cytochrome c-552)
VGLHLRPEAAAFDDPMAAKGHDILHHVRSPLLNVNNACQTCHKWPEEALVARAETGQRTVDLRNRAMDALVG